MIYRRPRMSCANRFAVQPWKTKAWHHCSGKVNNEFPSEYGSNDFFYILFTLRKPPHHWESMKRGFLRMNRLYCAANSSTTSHESAVIASKLQCGLGHVCDLQPPFSGSRSQLQGQRSQEQKPILLAFNQSAAVPIEEKAWQKLQETRSDLK